MWHSKFIDSALLINHSSLPRRVNILTAHVLVSLKMGALCNAETTAMTAWRLFMSQSFCEKFKYTEHTLRRVYNGNICKDSTTMSCCLQRCVPWQCECTDSVLQLWSSTSVHGGSLVPPKNLSRGKNKTKQKNRQITMQHSQTHQKQTRNLDRKIYLSYVTFFNEDFRWVQSKTGSSALLNLQPLSPEPRPADSHDKSEL